MVILLIVHSAGIYSSSQFSCFSCTANVRWSLFLFKRCAPSSAQTLLVAVDELKKELETLQYREHKRFAIQGQITAVRYMTSPKTTELPAKEVMEVFGKRLFRSGQLRHWVPAGSRCASSRCRPTRSWWSDFTGRFNFPISWQNPSKKKNSAEVSLGKRWTPWKSSDFSFKWHVFQRGDATCTSQLFSSQKVEKGSPDGCSSEVILSRGLSCCRKAEPPEEQDSESDAEPLRDAERHPPLQSQGAPLAPADSDVLSWESSSWEKQREEVTEHLCRGGLHQDSFHRRFTLDDKDVLVQWSNLQPTHWEPEQDIDIDTVPPADCPGYYQVTILGKETLWLLSHRVGTEQF